MITKDVTVKNRLNVFIFHLHSNYTTDPSFCLISYGYIYAYGSHLLCPGMNLSHRFFASLLVSDCSIVLSVALILILNGLLYSVIGSWAERPDLTFFGGF